MECSYLGLDIEKIRQYFSQINKIKNDKEICPYILEGLEAEVEKDNIIALYELGEIYSAGILVGMNNEIAMSYYERFIETDIVSSVNAIIWDEGGLLGGIREDVSETNLLAYLQVEELQLSSMIGDASAKLGYYYKYSSNHKAQYYFRTAMSHGFNCKKEYMELSSSHTRNSYNNNLTLKKIDCNEIREQLMSDFGVDNWNKLEKFSQSSLITCLFCYEQLCSLDEFSRDLIDFSAAVMPLAKSFERELGIRFYYHYLKFCREKYPDCNEYISINKFSKEDVSKHSKIIRYSHINKIHYYVNLKTNFNFTFGNFAYIYGVQNIDSMQDKEYNMPDETGILYCIEKLLKPQYQEREYAKSFLLQLRNQIYSFMKLRNDSAHGGNIISYYDATNCINEILTIKKILKSILDKCVI